MGASDNFVCVKDLAPDLSPSFSPNLFHWLRARGTGRHEGLVLDHVYRVKPASKLARSLGAGTLVIGHPYEQYDGDADVSGRRMIEVLCNGAAANRLCLVAAASSLELIEDFWTRYKQVGRCAFDPLHQEHFIDTERYIKTEMGKTCTWCGADCAHKE